MAHIDIKVSVWQRIQIPENVPVLDVIKHLEQNNGTGDLMKIGIDPSTFETLHDTEVELSPEENRGRATIEIVETEKTIWVNLK